MRAFLATLFVCLGAQAQNPTANITVDANANRRAINPNIYGLAYASSTQLHDLNVPLNRYGGNNTTRYNWQINGDNRGQDWYFESIGDTSSVAGERGNTFIANTRRRSPGHDYDSDHRLGGEARVESVQACKLFSSEVWSADRQ